MNYPLVLSFLTFVISPTPVVKSSSAQAPQQAKPVAVDPDHAKKRTYALVKTMRELDTNVTTAVQGRTLDGYFDFEALSRASIQPHAAQLSKNDQAQLQRTFCKLIRLLAYQAGRNFRSGDVTVVPSQSNAQATTRSVEVTVGQTTDDDDETQISFVWADHQGTLKVVDVALDGASIVKDYENQFGRILRKEGARALINKMQSRLIEAQRKRSI